MSHSNMNRDTSLKHPSIVFFVSSRNRNSATFAYFELAPNRDALDWPNVAGRVHINPLLSGVRQFSQA